MTLPNCITIARFLAIPFILYFMLTDQLRAAFGVFLVAGLSDAVDGAIARHFRQRSVLGAWLDPMADKLLLVSVYIVLAYLAVVPLWLVILVVFRDLAIGTGVLLTFIMHRPVTIAPLFVSKLNTTAQIVLAVAALANQSLLVVPGWLLTSLVWITAGLTLASFASYFLVWRQTMFGSRPV